MNFDEINGMFCAELLKHSDPRGKTILDVGCGNGELVKYIARNHAPRYIVGVDPALAARGKAAEEEGANWRVAAGNAHALAFEDNSFDLVISFSTFEHIGDVKQALSEIKRVLKPFGKFYTEFMPIWTSAAGHHFIQKNTGIWNPGHIRLIPPWGHLYLSSDEMRDHLLAQGAGRDLAEEMIDFIYSSDLVNRYSRSDLARCFLNAEMLIRHYEERISFNRLGMILGDKDSELSADISAKIRHTDTKMDDLGVVGLRICLEKFANMDPAR